MNPEYINLGKPDTDFHDDTMWLFTSFGRFMAIWSEFEITVEVAIARLTNMTALDASIVLSDIQFGPKSGILKSLLAERGLQKSKAAIEKVMDIGKRNALVHSVPSADENTSRFAFIQRKVDNSYKIKAWEMSAEEFEAQVDNLLRAYYEVVVELDIKIADREQYAREARFLWPTSQI